MAITTLSSKGQITVPAEMVRQLHLRPGDKLTIVPVHDGLVLKIVNGPLVDALAGSVPPGVFGNPEEYVREERRSWPD